jgi:hypothetical protein
LSNGIVESFEIVANSKEFANTSTFNIGEEKVESYFRRLT